MSRSAMPSARIAWLLLAALALLGLRWWTWPSAEVSTDAGNVVLPVPRTGLPKVDGGRDTTPNAPTSLAQDPAAGTREPEAGALRDAFAVRKPPASPPAPVARQSMSAAPKPFVGPPVFVPAPPPPPPPPPPYQVIGSWRDDQGPSVFVSGSRGVQQGRVGDTLQGGYRIVAITAQQVLLRHVADQTDAAIAVPPAAQATLTVLE